jgi:hypothetical protein
MRRSALVAWIAAAIALAIAAGAPVAWPIG